jgi:ABC-2 type transport system ATP-binding protein
MSAIELTNVCKSFGNHQAVDNVSVSVPSGSIYGFIGPNGAGKTTTLRMVVDIIRPDSGSVEVLGLSEPSLIRQRIGYLPEERGMYKKMKCADFVAYIGTLKGMTPRDAKARAVTLVERFDLGKWSNKSIDSLSKGMQQKLQFASTIIHEPDLLILDEPFSGLDPVNVEVLKTAIMDYHKSGRTIIFSTHMMEQAERLCDSVFMIHRGRKVLDGSMSDIKSRASEPAVRLNCYGDTDYLESLPYVTRVREYGNAKEVFLTDKSAGQQLLADVVGKVTINSFDLSEPSLYDIFLKMAGTDEAYELAIDGDLVATTPTEGGDKS